MSHDTEEHIPPPPRSFSTAVTPSLESGEDDLSPKSPLSSRRPPQQQQQQQGTTTTTTTTTTPAAAGSSSSGIGSSLPPRPRSSSAQQQPPTPVTRPKRAPSRNNEKWNSPLFQTIDQSTPTTTASGTGGVVPQESEPGSSSGGVPSLPSGFAVMAGSSGAGGGGGSFVGAVSSGSFSSRNRADSGKANGGSGSIAGPPLSGVVSGSSGASADPVTPTATTLTVVVPPSAASSPRDDRVDERDARPSVALHIATTTSSLSSSQQPSSSRPSSNQRPTIIIPTENNNVLSSREQTPGGVRGSSSSATTTPAGGRGNAEMLRAPGSTYLSSSTRSTASASDETEEFLLEHSRVRGVFRIRFLFILILLLVCCGYGALWSMISYFLTEYLKESASSVSRSTLSNLMTQFRITEAELAWSLVRTMTLAGSAMVDLCYNQAKIHNNATFWNETRDWDAVPNMTTAELGYLYGPTSTVLSSVCAQLSLAVIALLVDAVSRDTITAAFVDEGTSVLDFCDQFHNGVLSYGAYLSNGTQFAAMNCPAYQAILDDPEVDPIDVIADRLEEVQYGRHFTQFGTKTVRVIGSLRGLINSGFVPGVLRPPSSNSSSYEVSNASSSSSSSSSSLGHDNEDDGTILFDSSYFVIVVFLSAETFGASVFGASSWGQSSATLPRPSLAGVVATRAATATLQGLSSYKVSGAVISKPEVVTHTLTAGTPSYMETQPTAIGSLLQRRFYERCQGGLAHTWYTISSGSGELQTVSYLVSPHVTNQFVVVCSLSCVLNDHSTTEVNISALTSGNRSSMELPSWISTTISSEKLSPAVIDECTRKTSSTYLVVQSEVMDQNSLNVLRTFIVLISVAFTLNFLFLLTLHFSISVPTHLLLRRIISTIATRKWEQTALERRMAKLTRYVWLRDIKSLMRTFSFMSSFYFTNRRYVPEYVVQMQLQQLRQTKHLDRLLNDITSELATRGRLELTKNVDRTHRQGAAAASSREGGDDDDDDVASGPVDVMGAQADDPVEEFNRSFAFSADRSAALAASVRAAPPLRAPPTTPALNLNNVHANAAAAIASAAPGTTVVEIDAAPATTVSGKSEKPGLRALFRTLALAPSVTLLYVHMRGIEQAYASNFNLAERQHAIVLSKILAVIRKLGGDSFERRGDIVAAAWNAFSERENHVRRAVQCALEIAQEFSSIRSKGFRMGIVVHTGPVVCGVVGDRHEAASVLFGKTASLTERLALLGSLVRSFNVIVTEPVRAVVHTQFECPIIDVVVDSDIQMNLYDARNQLPLQSEYTEAFSLFRTHQFSTAASRLASITNATGGSARVDPLVQRLQTLCAFYEQYPEQLSNPVTRNFPRWVLYEEVSLASHTRRSFTDHQDQLSSALVANPHDTFATVLQDQLTSDNRPSAIQEQRSTFFQKELRENLLKSDKGPSSATTSNSGAPGSARNASTSGPTSTTTKASSNLSGIETNENKNQQAEDGGAFTSSVKQQQSSKPLPQVLRATLIESVTWSLVNGKGATPPPPQHAALAQSMGGFQSVKNFGESLTQMPDAAAGALPTDIEASNGVTYVRGERVLGTGSFGCVYLGMEKHSGRLVAMKFLPLPSDDNEVRLLQNEVDTMESVTDANLVEFYGYAFVDNMIVLMMECLVAGSLSGMLSTFATLPEPTTINFMRDVLRGLHRLHSTGIVHRDVKPQNVLISTTGHCKISDFGASASIHELVRRHDGGAEVQGTPIYLAPEAARGHAEPKSDIWSVGIMYLQLTTGSIPYENITAATNVASVVFGIGTGRMTPTIPADLSPLARPFVEGCLATDVAKRMSATELLELEFFRQF